MKIIKNCFVCLILLLIFLGLNFIVVYNVQAFDEISDDLNNRSKQEKNNSIILAQQQIDNSFEMYSLGDLFVLHALFKDSSNGILNESKMSLGDLYILDQLFNGKQNLFSAISLNINYLENRTFGLPSSQTQSNKMSYGDMLLLQVLNGKQYELSIINTDSSYLF